MFYQIFLSPQVKRCAIITYKHGIHELLHELPNDLRLNDAHFGSISVFLLTSGIHLGRNLQSPVSYNSYILIYYILYHKGMLLVNL